MGDADGLDEAKLVELMGDASAEEQAGRETAVLLGPEDSTTLEEQPVAPTPAAAAAVLTTAAEEAVALLGADGQRRVQMTRSFTQLRDAINTAPDDSPAPGLSEPGGAAAGEAADEAEAVEPAPPAAQPVPMAAVVAAKAAAAKAAGSTHTTHAFHYSRKSARNSPSKKSATHLGSHTTTHGRGVGRVAGTKTPA